MEELYAENWPVVYGYLRSLGAGHTQAEDLASETFLRAIQKIDRYDGACKLSTWLCTIAKNLYFSDCRRRKRLVPLEEAAADDGLEEQLMTWQTAEHQTGPSAISLTAIP